MWTFATNSLVFSGLNLAVFRPTSDKMVQLVGVTHLQGSVDTLQLAQATGWVTVPATTPIQVQGGDVLGIFYDSLEDNTAVIPHRETQMGSNMAVVHNKNGSEIVKTNGFVSTANEVRRQLTPALGALVEAGSTMIEAGSTMVVTSSTVAPINAPVTSRQDFQVDACLPDQRYFVPQNFSSPYSYSRLEAGLQIFADLTVPCNGYLTSWQIVPNQNVIIGLNLGIFRRTVSGSLQLVGVNRFNNVNIEPYGGKNTWINLEAQPPLKVERGDMIGMFYDVFQTNHTVLTIPCKSGDQESKVGTTFITAGDEAEAPAIPLNCEFSRKKTNCSTLFNSFFFLTFSNY